MLCSVAHTAAATREGQPTPGRFTKTLKKPPVSRVGGKGCYAAAKPIWLAASQ